MPDMEQIYAVLRDYERRLRYLEAIDPGAGGGLTDHDHTAVVGDGGVLTGDEHDLWGEYLEIAKPAAPAANKMRLYASDDGAGVTRMYHTDSAGLATLIAGGGMGDVDSVDTIHAAAAPAANVLLALGAGSIFPADVVDWGTLTLDAQVFATSWSNAVAWVLANNVVWQTDTQTTNLTPRRTSTVIAIAHVTWQNVTAGRASFMNFRWDLNGVAGATQGPLGSQVARREGHPIIGIWTAVAAGAKALTLQAQKTVVAWQADVVTVASRFAIVFILPED